MVVTDRYAVRCTESGQFSRSFIRMEGRPEAASLTLTLSSPKKLSVTAMVYDEEGWLRLQSVLLRDSSPVTTAAEEKATTRTALPGSMGGSRWVAEVLVQSRQEVFRPGEILAYLKADWSSEAVPREVSDVGFSSTTEHGARWYRGDFHAHSEMSDGFLSLERQLSLADEAGLDFVAVTDHNLAPRSAPASRALVVPGIELTSMLGHANLLFIEESPFQSLSLVSMADSEGMNRIFRRRGGAISSINHAFSSSHPFRFDGVELDLLDGLEIINNPRFRYSAHANEMGLAAWNVLLNDGRRTTGLAGSDNHFPPEFADRVTLGFSDTGVPSNYVYAEGCSNRALRDGVVAGHVLVTEGGCPEFVVGASKAGEVWRGEPVATLRLPEEGLVTEWVADGAIRKRQSGNVSRYDFAEEVPRLWLRGDIRRADGSLYGFTNPVFFGSRRPTLRTWGEVRSIVEAQDPGTTLSY